MSGAISPGVRGEGANGCSGEEPCVDMPVDFAAGDVSCPGCFLGGECLAAGELNADNPCQVCDPALDGAGWSANDGVACDDGSFCTTDDRCQAGACGGAARECDDGIDCNGVSICLEEEAACSPDENQCDDPPLCDVATGECVTDCEGCVVDGICFPPGGAAAQNPCLVCDPESSTSRLTAAEGLSCGSAGTECSAQDTCTAEGRCAPNDLESGAPCGAAVRGECDAADACDGNGRCVAQRAENGSACEDGLYCTVGDQCQASTCLGGGLRSCGPDERCSEEAGGCVCAGCTIAGSCVATGAQNPANACQICDPARSVESYSGNIGATCGLAATECSGQDACNEQGQCAPNHLAAGTACGAPDGQCDVGDACDGSGQCAQRVAQNGDPCDDGQFCTAGDTCQGGVCRSGGPRSCGSNQTCDESNEQCRCTGCLINGNCLGAGARNPANPCQICDPAQSSSAFINDVGANCGSPAVTCSDQDTCNAQGQCQPNHLPQGTECGGAAPRQCDAIDTCNGQGQCIARVAANGVVCEDGLFCTQGDTCQSGGCVGGGRNCNNQTCDENANRCGTEDGQPCTANADCLSGTCRTWFGDSDGDQFGGSTTTRTCGANPPGGFVAQGGDCCDLGGGNAAVAAQVHPGQQRFFPQGQVVCPNIEALDYNCSGAVEVGPHPPFTQCRDLTLSECSSPETATVWGTDFDPTPDLCGFPAQASVCQPVFNQCDDSGEVTFIGIPCH